MHAEHLRLYTAPRARNRVARIRRLPLGTHDSRNQAVFAWPGGAIWPREESNLRTQLRRLPLCPLSYGALAEALRAEARVTDGTRTHNHRDHNPGLYQLSYRHRGRNSLAA